MNPAVGPPGQRERRKLIEQTTEALRIAGEKLEELAVSCCLPGRGENMRAAQHHLARLVGSLEMDNDMTAARAALRAHGALIGEMYVTCCAPGRALLYQGILDQVTRAYDRLSQLDPVGTTAEYGQRG